MWARSMALRAIDHREHLRAAVGPALAADAGGVEQPHGAAAHLEQRVDDVARGSGDLRDQHALVAEQPVGERGLADVGAPDDRHRELGRLLGGFLLVGRGQQRLERLPQVADAAPVLGGQHDHGEAEADEVRVAEVGVAPVGLVDRQHHRRAGAAHRVGDLAVGGDEALRAVDDEHDGVGLGDGAQRLVADHARDLGLGVGLEAAGVDEDDAAAGRARRVGGDAVAGHARQVVGQRPPPACQPVEQRRLSHVRAPYDRHRRRHPFRLRRP